MPKLTNDSYYLGIDPGKNGSMSLVNGRGKICVTSSSDAVGGPVSCNFAKLTDHEICLWLAEAVRIGKGNLKAALEKVGASPQMGTVSAFTFGKGYGYLRGILAALQVPYVEVRPQVWQQRMQCLSKGDKNVTKAKAHQKWPAFTSKITHANADSLLIAEWMRLEENK